MKVLLLASCLSPIAFGGWQQITRGDPVYQGGPFSEEHGGWGPEATPRGFCGWRCTGGNCDNKQMRAPNFGEYVLEGNVIQGKSDISEENGRNLMNCGRDRLIYRLRCRGGNCDNTDVWCKQLKVINGQRIQIIRDVWTDWFSEEWGGLKDCPANSWLWGFHCKGGSCDDMRLNCVYLQKYVPNSCQVSGFGGWSNCSKSCGGGSQTRSRSVTRPAESGGQGCPALSESRSCNTQACPVDCAVGDFGEWGQCSEECGGGEQTRTRSVTRPAKNNGKPCPALSQKRACNEEVCCSDLTVQNKRLKVKGKNKTKKKSFKGEDAEDTACQCLEYCQGQDAKLYWSSALNNSGTKGKCQCFGGKLKKVLDTKEGKNNVCGGVDEEAHESVTKKIK